MKLCGRITGGAPLSGEGRGTEFGGRVVGACPSRAKASRRGTVGGLPEALPFHPDESCAASLGRRTHSPVWVRRRQGLRILLVRRQIVSRINVVCRAPTPSLRCKGGVGKSTVSTQIAQALASRGYSVGLLDVDICGPSVPRMCGVLGRTVHQSQRGWEPVYATPNLAVMSISFLLAEGDAAVVWRGPRKNGLIKQFLTETAWGDAGLDYLLVDTPPGTSDEHISIVQYLNDARPGHAAGASGAVVVTTPEEVSMSDVRKELNFCRKTGVPVLGIVENMAGLRVRVADLVFLREEQDPVGGAGDAKDCTAAVLALLREKCPEVLSLVAATDVFPVSGSGPRGMARQYNVPYLGKLPLDTNLLKACEDGVCFVESYPSSPATLPLNGIVNKLILALPVEEEDEDEEMQN